MLWVPNIPHESVPDGPDDSYNVIYEPQGAPLPEFDFEPKAHWDLGPELGILDFERGVKLSGSRFYIMTGGGRPFAARFDPVHARLSCLQAWLYGGAASLHGSFGDVCRRRPAAEVCR